MRNRDRPRFALPKFEPGFSLDPEFVRYDHIEINLTLGVARGGTAQIHRAFKRIARNSDLLRNDGSESKPRLSIKKRRAHGNGWIFSGMVGLVGDGKVKAFLHINPHRYFANSTGHPRRGAARRSGRGSEPYRLEANMQELLKAVRQTEDKSHNFIIRERLLEAWRTDWNALLLNNIWAARDLIVSEIERFAPPDAVFHLNDAEWTIAKAEIAWEFAAADAVLTAECCGRHADNLFLETKELTHRNAIDREVDARHHVFKTGKKNVIIVLYAKASDRLRLEVRFNGNPKTLYPAEMNNTRFSGKHLATLPGLMNALQEQAAELAEPLCRASRTYDPQEVLDLKGAIFDLAALAYYAKGNQPHMYRVLQYLYAGGVVSEVPGDTAFNNLLSQLAQRGLLIRHRKKANRPIGYTAKGSLRHLVGAAAGRN